MMANLQAIKDEVGSNPAGLPYLPMTEENAVANANIINNTDGANPRVVNEDEVDASRVRAATTFDAFDGLTASEESWFRWLTSGERISVTADTLRSLAAVNGNSLWASTDKPVMEPRMQAILQRTGSRAEELKDTIGVSYVSPSQMRDAALLP